MAPIILIILQQNIYGKDSLASIIIGHLRIPQITEPQPKSEKRKMHPRNVVLKVSKLAVRSS
jgi:hypothetical protein